MPVAGEAETRYARTPDGAHVAYQVLGSGTPDLVSVGYGTHFSIDMRDEEVHVRRFEQRLASFSRFIRFDPRGIGLSDELPSGMPPAADAVVDDVVAVLDAADSPRASLLSVALSSLHALRAAAERPERIASLILIHGTARIMRDVDYPFGFPQRILDRFLDSILDVSRTETDPDMDDVRLLTPSLQDDAAYRQWWSRAGRLGASPAVARAIQVRAFRTDVRDLLPLIEAPTLVLHRNPSLFGVEHSRYLADHLPHAHFVELPGGDHLPYGEGSDAILDEIEEFLTGSRGGAGTDRVLTTVLFTDIVSSTEQLARSGDRSWHEVLDRHDSVVRAELARFGGREVKTTGDGILATFDSPARAIRCARSICAGATSLGVEVRAGVHTGEVEVRGNDISGIAVHLAQRVSARAAPGEVLVSRTVVDLVAGSGIAFHDRGTHELKGLEGPWQLFSVED
jgi:class 3 adenylate cyclase/pimeloyl-ACP methyl ester carboxylesterase